MATTSTLAPQLDALPLWNRLRTRLVLNFVFLAVGSIIVVTGVTLYQVHEQSNRQVISQLESVAELKQSQIGEWLSTSETVVNIIKSNLLNQTTTQLLLEGKNVGPLATININ